MNTYYIDMHAEFGTNLSLRQYARDLVDKLKVINCDQITISFEGIETASRSFLDEYYKLFVSDSKVVDNVVTVAMSRDVEAIFNSVKKTQEFSGTLDGKSFTNATVYEFKTLDELSDHLDKVLCQQ